MSEQPPASSPAVWWSPEYQRFYALPGTPPLVEEVETRFMPSDIQPMVPDTGQAREPSAGDTWEAIDAAVQLVIACDLVDEDMPRAVQNLLTISDRIQRLAAEPSGDGAA